MMRPFKHMSFFGPLAVFFGVLRFVYHGTFTRGYEPDRLTYVSRRIGGKMGLPLNTLNQRTSAHYIEINHIYSAEMLKRYAKIRQRIVDERSKSTEEVKKTKYADPSYKYIPSKGTAIPPLPYPFGYN